jgi:hypothetical protein
LSGGFYLFLFVALTCINFSIVVHVHSSGVKFFDASTLGFRADFRGLKSILYQPLHYFRWVLFILLDQISRWDGKSRMKTSSHLLRHQLLTYLLNLRLIVLRPDKIIDANQQFIELQFLLLSVLGVFVFF